MEPLCWWTSSECNVGGEECGGANRIAFLQVVVHDSQPTTRWRVQSRRMFAVRHLSDALLMSLFHFQIRYIASAARASISDPQQPIALEQARGIPGLMTVIG